MKKALTVLAALALVFAVATHAHSQDHHIKASLEPVDNSGVSGFVQLTQLPHGGANLMVNASGLKPGTVYASFYYESAACDGPHDLFGTFTANPAGKGQIQGKIDDDLDEVGSVSVRLGPGYGTLLACAKVH